MKTRLVMFLCALVSAPCLTVAGGELDQLLTGDPSPEMSFSSSYFAPFGCGYGGGYGAPPWCEETSRHVRACKDRCDAMINCDSHCRDGSSEKCTACVANLVACKLGC